MNDGGWSGDGGAGEPEAVGDADEWMEDGGCQWPDYCFVLAPPDVGSRDSVVGVAAVAAVADVFGVSCAVVSKARISPGASGVADAADAAAADEDGGGHWSRAGPC